jgi:hypothetical protein
MRPASVADTIRVAGRRSAAQQRGFSRIALRSASAPPVDLLIRHIRRKDDD